MWNVHLSLCYICVLHKKSKVNQSIELDKVYTDFFRFHAFLIGFSIKSSHFSCYPNKNYNNKPLGKCKSNKINFLYKMNYLSNMNNWGIPEHTICSNWKKIKTQKIEEKYHAVIFKSFSHWSFYEIFISPKTLFQQIVTL